MFLVAFQKNRSYGKACTLMFLALSLVGGRIIVFRGNLAFNWLKLACCTSAICLLALQSTSRLTFTCSLVSFAAGNLLIGHCLHSYYVCFSCKSTNIFPFNLLAYFLTSPAGFCPYFLLCCLLVRSDLRDAWA